MYTKKYQLLSSIKKMHTKENWFPFFLLTVYNVFWMQRYWLSEP